MTADQIGRRAETYAQIALSMPAEAKGGRVLFQTTPLGDKYPTLDLLVDLIDDQDEAVGYFFVQVKGTTKPRPPGGRLPVEVELLHYNRMVRHPSPTYLIGVDLCDLRQPAAYLIAASAERAAMLSSMSRTFDLAEDAVRIALYDEVVRYWAAVGRPPHHSRFCDD